MDQMSLATTGFELTTKRTRKRECLEEMDVLIPWSELVALIAPHVRPAIAVIAGLAAACWALLCMMVEVSMYG